MEWREKRGARGSKEREKWIMQRRRERKRKLVSGFRSGDGVRRGLDSYRRSGGVIEDPD